MSPPVRANRNGHPCPSWCAADHDEELLPGIFLSAHTGADTKILVSDDTYPYVTVRPVMAAGNISVQAAGPSGGDLVIHPGAALSLALVIEALSAATSDQHGQLAEALRRAAERAVKP